MHDDRHGAKQPRRFDPARAAILDDRGRFAYVDPGALLAALAQPPSGTIVDFGAGTGLYAIALARLRPDVHVTALDEQSEMLDHLRRALERDGVPNVEAVGPDALPGLRGRADGVLALNVLHELGDDALATLHGLLRPGAPALFVDWNADVERPVGPPNDHVYGAKDGLRRLREAGFAVEAREPLPYHYVLVAR